MFSDLIGLLLLFQKHINEAKVFLIVEQSNHYSIGDLCYSLFHGLLIQGATEQTKQFRRGVLGL